MDYFCELDGECLGASFREWDAKDGKHWKLLEVSFLTKLSSTDKKPGLFVATDFQPSVDATVNLVGKKIGVFVRQLAPKKDFPGCWELRGKIFLKQ